jgi:hypothetical protein
LHISFFIFEREKNGGERKSGSFDHDIPPPYHYLLQSKKNGGKKANNKQKKTRNGQPARSAARCREMVKIQSLGLLNRK